MDASSESQSLNDKVEGQEGKRDVDLAMEFLDATGGEAMSATEKNQAMMELMKNENAYEVFASFIVPLDDSGGRATNPLTDIELKRSYHSMEILAEDQNRFAGIGNPMPTLLNPSKAGLLTKMLFSGYQPTSRAHLPHVNHLLKSLLTNYPNATISAACAGGKNGIETNLGQMLLLRDDHLSSSFSLSVFADLVSKGCCDSSRPMTNQSVSDALSKGHRRKFVRCMGEWDLIGNLVTQIEAPELACPSFEVEADLAKDLHADAACDAFVTIADSLAFPSTGDDNSASESHGEETLLKPLGERSFVDRLVAVATATNGESGVSLQRRTTASKALLTAFQLSTERRKKEPSLLGQNLAADAENETEKTTERESVMAGIGVTKKMYHNLVEVLPLIVHGLELPSSGNDAEEEDTSLGEDGRLAVLHPGGCAVDKPFTTRRLLLVTLLAEILSFECDIGTESTPAMDKLLTMADGEATEASSKPLVWHGLCDLFFAYPENNLYQVQFFRLLQSVLKRNHEPTLKIVIQKCKLASRLIKVCNAQQPTASSPHRGSSLQCLNAIRLQSQALSPKSFLRHYLDSHDGWKAFLPTMKEMTIERQKLGGGVAVPEAPVGTSGQQLRSSIPSIDEADLETAAAVMPQTSSSSSSAKVLPADIDIDIDLGSPFASKLGFDAASVKMYVEEQSPDDSSSPVPASGTAKKKKKGKKKKKK